MNIRFGATCPPISKQLGISKKVGGAYDRDAEAIDRLRIRGIITERETHNARTRLLKRIGKELNS